MGIIRAAGALELMVRHGGPLRAPITPAEVSWALLRDDMTVRSATVGPVWE